jgi:hypothetical protein
MVNEICLCALCESPHCEMFFMTKKRNVLGQMPASECILHFTFRCKSRISTDSTKKLRHAVTFPNMPTCGATCTGAGDGRPFYSPRSVSFSSSQFLCWRRLEPIRLKQFQHLFHGLCDTLWTRVVVLRRAGDTNTDTQTHRHTYTYTQTDAHDR